MKTVYLETGNKGSSLFVHHSFSPRNNFFYLAIRRFMVFARSQEANHFAWLAIAFFVQGCVISPLTILSITLNGNVFALYIPCLFAFAITEITLLAALPTKITIPVFFSGVIVDLGVILASFMIR